MFLQTILDQRKITRYQLSEISGVPKTTLTDICSGKSSIDRCSAKTVWQLTKALECTMEDLMNLESPSDYNEETGLPKDERYLEYSLPEYLNVSLCNMKTSWDIIDSGRRDSMWDLYWCELNADINSAEVDQLITSEQASYLRINYLRMNNNGD